MEMEQAKIEKNYKGTHPEQASLLSAHSSFDAILLLPFALEVPLLSGVSKFHHSKVCEVASDSLDPGADKQMYPIRAGPVRGHTPTR
jgi:hypothetical protein